MVTTAGLIGCENETLGVALREQLVHNGLVCEARNVIELSQLADRASLEMPDLIVVEQPALLADAVELTRELAMVAPSYIISIGPAQDPRRIMAIMQAGANEYVDIDQWQLTLQDSIVRFRTRNSSLVGRESRGRVIGIICPSGGGGGSTIAANVATVLSRKEASAMLVDLRLEAGDLPSMLDLHPTFNLADLCNNLNRLDDSLFEQLLTPHPNGVHLLAAPQDSAATEQVTTKGFRRALALGKRKFPYIVCDLGGIHLPVQQEAAAQADILAMVMRLDFPSIRNARRCLDQLAVLGVNRSKVRMVVNRYGQARQLTTVQAQDALGCKIDLFLPDDASSSNLALNSGKPVVHVKPWSKFSRRLVDLANRLNGRHTES